MKISVIGIGAMGSIYAALMAQSGHEVCAIDTWVEHINEIKMNGLRIEGASGDRIVQNISVSTDIQISKNSNLYIISTKSSHVESVAKELSSFIKAGQIVLTIQNGLGSAERVAKYINPENIIIGVAEGFGASVIKPGHVHHNAMKLIRLGEMKKVSMKRVEELSKVWMAAGFKTKAFSDINRLMWEKFISNVTFSGPCAVFACTLGELISTPYQWSIAIGCMREAYEIGIKRGVSFSFDEPEQYVRDFGNRMPNAKPSMLLDHEKSRLSEINAINGMVFNLGQVMGIKTPYNEAITAMVIKKEETLGAK